MALESEPQSTLLGGSNLDALKSESSNNVDLEDGEIDDDDDDVPVPASVPAQVPPPATLPKPSFAARTPPTPKGHDPSRRESPQWAQHRTIHKPQIANKNNKKPIKRAWDPPHKKPFATEEEDDDDFATHLEKALREKAQKHQALKEPANEDGEAEDSDDDHWRKKKKRKKRWDEDEEREPKHRRKSREGDDRDEDDMIFVRGASPQHREAQGSPSFEFKSSFENYAEEDEEYEEISERNNHGGFLGRGRGRGSKMVRGRGRGRLGMSGEGLRGGFGKRGIKRGGARGGSLGKPLHLMRDRGQDGICSYFMQGKCAKGPDDCPYSHDAHPPRKMELCKFYLMNCCAKREKCLYMHKDFPCKFFHTGRRCDSGEHCRFSHDKLSDVTRNVLLKHLELAPKEILGEFKRFTREQANQIIDKAAKLRSQGRNPEGLNLLTFDEEGGYNSGDDRAHTPMPSSPGEPIPHEGDSKRSRDDGAHGSRKRDFRDKHREHDRSRPRDHHQDSDRKDHGDRKDRGEKRDYRERRRKRRWDSPDSSPTRLEKLQQLIKNELLEHDITDRSDVHSSSVHFDTERLIDNEQKIKEDENQSRKNDTAESPVMPLQSTKKESEFENSGDKKDEESPATSNKPVSLINENSGDSGGESQDSSGAIPSHLPKRQRELFMRIQHQQHLRESDHSQDNKASECVDEPPPEDDWYSTDEDEPTSLTDLLKNLPKGQKTDEKSIKTSGEGCHGARTGEASKPTPPQSQPLSQTVDQLVEKPSQQLRRPPLLPTPTILTDLMKNSAIDQLLSSIRYGTNAQGKSSTSSNLPLHTTPAQVPPTSTLPQQDTSSAPVGLQSPGQSAPLQTPAPVRDPRLSRDPRSRGAAAVSVPSPAGSPSSHQPEGRPDPRLERVDVRSDPRLDPRSERRDPRTDPRIEHRSSVSDPRTDNRSDVRPADPRAARMEVRRSSEGSSSSSGSNSNVVQYPQPSIYDSACLPASSGAGDVDLRVRSVGQDHMHSTEFHLHNAQLGAGDMDMRRPAYPTLAGSHHFPAQDTDLRFGLNNPVMDIDGEYASSHNDLDLRRLEMMLPFKPAPAHMPATEINASLSSYTPGPYRVFLIDIPRPDFSSLKINAQDPQAKLDPRLRRVFRLSQDEPPSGNTLSSPSSEPVQASTTVAPVIAPSDPRRRNSTSSRPADPRQARTGSAMSNFGSSTPRMEDFDDPNAVEPESHAPGYFGQPAWEGMNRGRGLLPHPERPDAAPWIPPGRPRPPPPLQRPSYH